MTTTAQQQGKRERMPVGIFMICCTQVLLNDIEQKVPNGGIASTYAHAIKSWQAGADEPDWKTINGAISADRGMKGLIAIKKAAWKIVESRP